MLYFFVDRGKRRRKMTSILKRREDIKKEVMRSYYIHVSIKIVKINQ